jgi:hypothetical protein
MAARTMTVVIASAKHHNDAVPIERLADGSIRLELKGGFWSRQIVTLTPVELAVRREGLFRASEDLFPVEAVTGFGVRMLSDGEGGKVPCIAFEANGATHRIGSYCDQRLLGSLAATIRDAVPELAAPTRTGWQPSASRVRITRTHDGMLIDIAPANLNAITTDASFPYAVIPVIVALYTAWLALNGTSGWIPVAIPAALMMAYALWQVGHGERLRLKPGEVECTWCWMGLPLRRRVARVGHISRIELPPNSEAEGLVDAIAIKADGRPWRVGENLSLIEANGIVDEMVKIAPGLERVVVAPSLPAPEAHDGPGRR